jgi:CPA2 family monovalent cation:H+ antiporter-2
MPHETALIGTIAASIALAFLFGFAATFVRLPPLVGYLLAGVAVGPFTPGFVADTGIAQQLSEIGIILLMFGVGIHFSVADLLAVRRIALPGAVVQIGVATALGAGVSHLWGWSWGAGIVFGLCLSVASTVVLLRALEDRGMLESSDGRIAVGWLIVEDLATVIVLVLLPLAVTAGGSAEGASSSSSGTGGLLGTIALTLGKVAAFVAFMFLVARRVVPWLLARVAKVGSRELFTLSVLAVALGIAVGAAALFGVSFALGAFFAGMVINGSELSHEAAKDALPLQDAFSVLFFVAVGMLFDPSILMERPLEVLMVVLIVMVGKSLAAFFIVVALRYTARTALTISASLAQVGEFSFILAALAVSLKILPPEGQSFIVAGALISISLNPAAFAAAGACHRWLSARPRLSALFEGDSKEEEVPGSAPIPELSNHVILVGHGRVGRLIAEALSRRGMPYLVIEQDRDTTEALRARGVPALHGDAARPEILEQAGVGRARILISAVPDPYQSRALIEQARAKNPSVETVARSHSEDERSYLESHGANLALIGEYELALELAEYALVRMGCDKDEADATVQAIRGRPRAGALGAMAP